MSNRAWLFLFMIAFVLGVLILVRYVIVDHKSAIVFYTVVNSLNFIGVVNYLILVIKEIWQE
jgi:hypothetical protein